MFSWPQWVLGPAFIRDPSLGLRTLIVCPVDKWLSRDPSRGFPLSSHSPGDRQRQELLRDQSQILPSGSLGLPRGTELAPGLSSSLGPCLVEHLPQGWGVGPGPGMVSLVFPACRMMSLHWKRPPIPSLFPVHLLSFFPHVLASFYQLLFTCMLCYVVESCSSM